MPTHFHHTPKCRVCGADLGGPAKECWKCGTSNPMRSDEAALYGIKPKRGNKKK